MSIENASFILSEAPEATEKLAAALARKLSPGWVIALYGELGSGKTTFARGFARGLGITEPVTSPTFTIVQEYQHGAMRLYHLDMYRINSTGEALSFGIEEFLFCPDAITLIEWPERIPELLPASEPNLLQLHFVHEKDMEKRRIYGIPRQKTGSADRLQLHQTKR